MLPAVFVFLCCLFSFSSLGKFLNGSVWPPLCSQTDPSGPKAQCQQYTNCYLITSKFGFPGPRPKWARPLILLILRPTHPNHSFSRQIKIATFGGVTLFLVQQIKEVLGNTGGSLRLGQRCKSKCTRKANLKHTHEQILARRQEMRIPGNVRLNVRTGTAIMTSELSMFS